MFEYEGYYYYIVIMIKHRVSMLFICQEMCLIYSHIIKTGLVITYRTCYEKDSRENASLHIRFYL